MTIEIVDFPMKHGYCPSLCNSLPEGRLRHGEIKSQNPKKLQCRGFKTKNPAETNPLGVAVGETMKINENQ
jgi:hypothetical protein